MQVRATILSAALATFFVAPTFAGTFSAQDVLTICMTTRSSPETIPALFRKQGWLDITDDAEAQQWLALSYLAGFAGSSSGEPYNPRDWSASWSIANGGAAANVSEEAGADWSFLRDQASGAFLAIRTTSRGAGLTVGCYLAVPAAATAAPGYHPKLPGPDSRGAFFATTEVMSPKSVRTLAISVSVAVDPSAIERELGVKTDIAAVFSTSLSYPAWAVAE